MKNIFEVIALDRLLRVEQIEEFLHELWRNIALKLLDFDRLVDDKLQEELVNTLQVWPGWVHLLLLVDASFSKVELVFVDAWKRSKDVLFNHLYRYVEAGNNGAHCDFLVCEHSLNLLDGI